MERKGFLMEYTQNEMRQLDIDGSMPDNTTRKSPKKKKKRGKEPLYKTVLRVVISIVLLAIGVFIILLLVAKAARFDSIASMLQHMSVELSLMWQRIIS